MQVNINGKKFKKYIVREEINTLVDKLAAQINLDYKNKSVLFLVVLKGSIFFAADLLRKITIDSEIETVRASSYGKKMTNSNVRLCVDNLEIKGRNVIIIEDIVDTGNTIRELLANLKKENPKSIEIVSFLLKPESFKTDATVKYVGKEIASKFVIGYGLDYAEKGRNLPDIYILDD